MSHAFFVRDWNQPLQLPEAEVHHLIKVLRLKPGQSIELLDGQGRTAQASIAKIGKNRVDLELDGQIKFSPRPQPGLTLALGWAKSARRSFLLEKSVEFEAAGIWFWQAERSQYPLPDPGPDASKAGWQAQMQAGAKQSRNPWLPDLRALPGGLSQLQEQSNAFAHKYVLLGRNEAAEARILSADLLRLPGEHLCVLGPEGGLSGREIASLLDHGFAPLCLGERVLRWESAALLCLGLHWWARQTPAQAD